MTIEPSSADSPGAQRYRSVVEGVELANEFTRSRMTAGEFGRLRTGTQLEGEAKDDNRQGQALSFFPGQRRTYKEGHKREN